MIFENLKNIDQVDLEFAIENLICELEEIFVAYRKNLKIGVESYPDYFPNSSNIIMKPKKNFVDKKIEDFYLNYLEKTSFNSNNLRSLDAFALSWDSGCIFDFVNLHGLKDEYRVIKDVYINIATKFKELSQLKKLLELKHTKNIAKKTGLLIAFIFS